MNNQTLQTTIVKLASLIESARRFVVFTGAGISTESGIPDFRSPDGIWTKYDPEDFTYQRYLSSAENRRMSWQHLKDGRLWEAQPNPAHLALAELERMGKLACIVTQNIDELHQKAGNQPENVIELHGTTSWCVCLDCGARFPSSEILDRLNAGEEIPDCKRCGGMLKTAVVSFGQQLPEDAIEEAQDWAKSSDLFLVIGSSLVVYPAAAMPVMALQAGAKLAIINIGDTPLDRHAEVLIKEKAGEVMPKVVESLQRRMVN